MGRQPAAPYYMAQALIVQEEALKAAEQRIAELERQAGDRPAQSGSFLGGLFGGGGSASPHQGSVPSAGSVPRAGGGFSYPRDDRAPMDEPRASPYGQASGGGGFLSGALQTATGVAGGVILGNMVGDLFKGHGVAAAQPAAPQPAAAPPIQQAAQQADNTKDQDDDDRDDDDRDDNQVENADYEDDDYQDGDGDDGGLDI
jgi:hypothetical protein